MSPPSGSVVERQADADVVEVDDVREGDLGGEVRAVAGVSLPRVERAQVREGALELGRGRVEEVETAHDVGHAPLPADRSGVLGDVADAGMGAAGDDDEARGGGVAERGVVEQVGCLAQRWVPVGCLAQRS